MLVATLVDKAATKDSSLLDGCRMLLLYPQVRAEVLELMEALEARITHVPSPLAKHPDGPLPGDVFTAFAAAVA